MRRFLVTDTQLGAGISKHCRLMSLLSLISMNTVSSLPLVSAGSIRQSSGKAHSSYPELLSVRSWLKATSGTSLGFESRYTLIGLPASSVPMRTKTPSFRLNVGSVDPSQIFAGRFLRSNSSSFWGNELMYGRCLLLAGRIINPRCLSCKEQSDPISCSESLQPFFDGFISLHITQTCGTSGLTVLLADSASLLCSLSTRSFHASLLDSVCQQPQLTALPVSGLDFLP